MKLEIPFYDQKNETECGSVALKMILEYFDEKYDKEYLKKLLDTESSGMTWTVAVAKASAQLGFKTDFYSTSLGFNPENFNLSYYQKFTDGAVSVQDKLMRIIAKCIEFNVKLEEKTLTLEELLGKINDNCVPIILIDWSKVVGKDKYLGHIVPIVGYDEENVYIHDSGPINPTPYYKISREVFELARKANGTDEDILFVHRKFI